MARFGRAQRLLKRGEFSRVFSGQTKSIDGLFVVLGYSSGRASGRLGLAIAKKHLKRAVDRNRIRRLIRESFRHHLELLEGLDVVVLSRHRLDGANNRAVFASLDQHWHRLRKRCKSS